MIEVRRARTADVRAIRDLVEPLTATRVLVAKDAVAYYEGLQQFRVAEVDGRVLGCGALHVLWSDLGEIRTLAVHPDTRQRGVGRAVLDALVDVARDLGLSRLFALTFHTAFFGHAGFTEIEGTPVDQAAYEALRRSYDPGVAEFLGLEYAKPNTLGNTRMLLNLD